MRASCDAILVGAATVRNDNPRLLVRSKARRNERTARGLAPSPIKVTVTERVGLDARADFFTTGDTEKLVYCASQRVVDARSRLGQVATVVDGGQPVEMRRISEDLGARGVQRLMVEGGGKVHTQFLTDNLADELQLVVAPFFVGDSRAPRFVSDGRFPLEPRAARHARRGPPDRRRGAAALRALAQCRTDRPRRFRAAAPPPCDNSHPVCPRPWTRRPVSVGLVDGQEDGAEPAGRRGRR